MDQIRHNTDAAVMNGDFPKAMDTAVIARMDTQQGMALKYLSEPQITKELQGLMLAWLRQQVLGGQSRRM